MRHFISLRSQIPLKRHFSTQSAASNVDSIPSVTSQTIPQQTAARSPPASASQATPTSLKQSNKLKPNIIEYPLSKLEAEFEGLGISAFRARIVYNHVYKKGAQDFQSCTSLSMKLREWLDETYRIDYGRNVKTVVSSDGTRKNLIELSDKRRVECVYVNMKERIYPPRKPSNKPIINQSISQSTNQSTSQSDDKLDDAQNNGSTGAVCLSSQVGCSLTCAFCATGHQTKSTLRNLTPGEIVGQLMIQLHACGDYEAALPSALPSTLSIERQAASGLVNSLIFMGSGEPLLNFRNLATAISIIQEPHGLAYGGRRITVSTSGVVPGIDKLREVTDVKLAISLHAVNNDLRDELVPINKQFDIHSLLQACHRYSITDRYGNNAQSKPRSQRARITFEYVMLAGVNDSVAEARELRRLMHDYQIDALINLIPFNSWPGSQFTSSSVETIEAFAWEVKRSLPCTVRWPKGADVQAACGQLAVQQMLEDIKSSIPILKSSTSEMNNAL